MVQRGVPVLPGVRRGPRSGMWHVACGMWHVACGLWRLACGVWHVACGVGARGRCQLQVFVCIGAISGKFLQPACRKSPRAATNSHISPSSIMKLPDRDGANTCSQVI